MKKLLKVCAGASAGGHMNQLLKLLDHAGCWPAQPAFYVTTLPELAGKLEERGPAFVIGECNRYHPLKALQTMGRAFSLVRKQRPDVVITTGSMPLALFCFFAKLFGSKVVWIDSVANMEKLSVSGRFASRFADLLLTQWPEVARKYKKAEFAGAIL